MNSVIYPTRPTKCHECPHRGRAWCLDGEGFPACDREDDLQNEDETIQTKEDDNEDARED